MKTKTKKRLGLVAVLLVLILAIGAAAGTTLAKYISSATKDSETATVAEWGYTISTGTKDLFSTQYDQTKIVEANNGTLDVKASAKVVAPGTSSSDAEGTMTITIIGSAQVDAKLEINVGAFETVWLKANTDANAALTNDYYPLEWKVNTTTVSTATEPNNATLATAIKDALNVGGVLPQGITASIDSKKPNVITVDLPESTNLNVSLTISWVWQFNNNHDVEDTILGWLAGGVEGEQGTSADGGTTTTMVDLDEYNEGDYNLKTTLGLSLTITQTQTQS